MSSDGEESTWTTVVRQQRAPKEPWSTAEEPFTPFQGMQRRYLNLIAEHLLEKSGPCELGSLGNLFPQPAELRGKTLKDMLLEADDIFSLEVFKSTGWAVRLKRGKLAPRVVSASGSMVPSTVPHLRKTQLCVDWQIKGQCARGATCSFAHGKTELKARPDRKPKCFEHEERDKKPTCEPRAASHGPMHAGMFDALDHTNLEPSSRDPTAEVEHEQQVLECPETREEGLAAHKKQLWSLLNESEQNAAATLGYDEYHWEHGLTPATCTFPWTQLATTERNAAYLLGYCQQSWDDELEPSTRNDELEKGIVSAVTTLMDAPPLLGGCQDTKSHTTEDTACEGDDWRSLSSTDPAGVSHQLSCKAKADAIRAELGLSVNLPMPRVVKEGFELVEDELPSGGLVKQVSALYTILFE